MEPRGTSRGLPDCSRIDAPACFIPQARMQPQHEAIRSLPRFTGLLAARPWRECCLLGLHVGLRTGVRMRPRMRP